MIIPVFTAVGDTPEEQAATRAQAKSQIALRLHEELRLQFDMLGFEGTSAKLNERLKAARHRRHGRSHHRRHVEYFAVTASWADLGPKLRSDMEGLSERLVMYQAEAHDQGRLRAHRPSGPRSLKRSVPPDSAVNISDA
ncbi:MAG: hypothetical protein R2710_11465 [Acidimicrobiales bacterium]